MTTHYRCINEFNWRHKSGAKQCDYWYDSQLRNATFGNKSWKCGLRLGDITFLGRPQADLLGGLEGRSPPRN